MKSLDILAWIGLALFVAFLGTLRAMLTFNSEKAHLTKEWIKTFLLSLGIFITGCIIFKLIL